MGGDVFQRESPERRVLRPNVVLPFAFWLFGIWISVREVTEKKSEFFPWLMLALFVLFGLLTLAAAISPRCALRLTSDGFAFGNLRQGWRFQWSEVAVFFPDTVGNRKRACFRLISSQHLGFDHWIRLEYGMTAEELVALMERWRVKYGQRTAPLPVEPS
jgi:hypothetical protein